MPVKILMVCLGNICRSPLAEGILQSKISKTICVVDSAGTANYHVGEAPDKRSIATAKKNGIDINNQKCRQIKRSDFETFDYIYVMDKNNYKNVIAIAPNKEAELKVQLILNELHPSMDLEVPDPYYGGIDGFEEVFKMLDDACNMIVQKINK